MAAIALMAAPFTANAQDAQGNDNQEEEAFSLDTIVVTARLREETLQTTPLSITALGGNMLEDRNINDVRTMLDSVPGVNFTNQGGPGLGNVSLRGLSQGSLIGDEANVASFVDGFYWSGRIAFDAFLDGLERVEIIRGPQSALYGRNSFSGAINYVTKKPSFDEIEGGGKLQFGEFGNKEIAGNISMPLAEDVLAIRIDASHLETGGTNINTANNERLNDANSENLRFQLGGRPSERLDFNYTFTFIDRDTTDQPLYAVPYDQMDGGYKMDFIQFAYRNHKVENPMPRDPSDMDRHVSDLIGGKYDVKRHTFRMNYEADTFTTSLLVAHTDEDITQLTDGSNGLGGNVILATLMDVTNPTAPPSFAPVDLNGDFIPDMFPTVGGQPIQEREDFSGELRFQSNDDDGPFTWAFGGFFSKLKYTDSLQMGYDIPSATMQEAAAWTNAPLNPTIINAGLLPGFYSCDPMGQAPCNVAPFFPVMTGTQEVVNGQVPTLSEKYFENKETSIFASIGFDLTESTRVNIEGRHTWENRYMEDRVELTRLYDTTFPEPLERSYKTFTPRFIIDHKVNDNAFIYAQAARGAKAGGVQPSSTAGRQFYDPETNWTYEAGAKFTLLDGHLNLNIAAFYVDWKNMQLRENVGLDNIVTNLGEAEVKGFEIMGAWRVHENVQFRYGWTYQDGKIKKGSTASAAGYCDMPQLEHELVDISSFGNPAAWNPEVQAACGYVPPAIPFSAPGQINVTTGNIEGNRMSNAPKHTLVMGLDVNIPINDDYEFFATADWNYRSQTYLDFENYTQLPGVHLVNANMGISSGDDWRLTVWARNLTNNNTPIAAIRDFNIFGQIGTAIQQREGRMFGATLSASF